MEANCVRGGNGVDAGDDGDDGDVCVGWQWVGGGVSGCRVVVVTVMMAMFVLGGSGWVVVLVGVGW